MSDDGWDSPWGGIPVFHRMVTLGELPHVQELFARLEAYRSSTNKDDQDIATILIDADLPWPKARLLLSRLKPPRKQGGRTRLDGEEHAAFAALIAELGREPTMSEMAKRLATVMTSADSVKRRLRRRRTDKSSADQ